MRFGLLLAALLVWLAPETAHAWWNKDWSFRKKITIDIPKGQDEIGNLTGSFPLLIRLHAGNFGFVDTAEDGGDLRFVAEDDKTLLPFQIERYDWANGLAYVWVQLPRLAGGQAPASLWLYFGNANAKSLGDGKSVWDSAQTLAYHFADRQTSPRDSTAQGKDPTRFTATLSPNGAIDFAGHFDGTQQIAVPAGSSLRIGAAGTLTVSAWVKSEASQSTVLFQQADGRKSVVLALDGDVPVLRVTSEDGRTVITPAAKGRLTVGDWHHLAMTSGAGRVSLFLDGVEIAAGQMGLPEMGGEITFGGGPAGAGFKGLLDEIRLANQPRNPAWLKAEAIAEAPDSKLLGFGEDEQVKSGGEYAAIIGMLFNSVTVDGWVVIALIALLGFVSGEVAIGKARLLGRARKGNDRFLEKFRSRDTDILTLAKSATGEPAEWTRSPLFAVYAAGAEELARLQESRQGQANFSSLSLEVVRAAVDTSLAREANKMNDKMVLLTLAVSGAPFLGLLGTVVGIMITFATIALKGDVNINTIAPGIAAAITATAAGMLVAIPALFGYNVLATRIKEVMSVMEAFRDEYLSKIAAQFA